MEQGEHQPTSRLQHNIIHGKRYLHSSRRLFHILYRLLFFVQFSSATSDQPPGLIPFIRISRLFHHRDKWIFCQLETGLYVWKKAKKCKSSAFPIQRNPHAICCSESDTKYSKISAKKVISVNILTPQPPHHWLQSKIQLKILSSTKSK